MEKYNVFNVRFVNDKNMDDETQFDISVTKNEKETKEEIIELFSDFCKENNIATATIICIEHVGVEEY